MGRERVIKAEVMRIINEIHVGKKNTIAKKRIFLVSLISDLKEINHLPYSLSNLNISVIEKLISLWKVNGDNENTICHKIAILRQILNSRYILQFPSNSTLGISRKNAAFIAPAANISINDFNDEVIKDVLSLQLKFGLKLSEALKINYYYHYREMLLVARNFSYNNKDRYVPFFNNDMQLFRDIMLKYQYKSIIDKHPKLRAKIKEALIHVNCDDVEHFRKIFIKNRYQMYLEQGKSPQESFQILLEETGIRNKIIIKGLKAWVEHNS